VAPAALGGRATGGHGVTMEGTRGADVTALQAAAGTMEGAGPATAQRFTALVVDDHPLLRESIVTKLRSMGAAEGLRGGQRGRGPSPGARFRPL
jgi:hypothetical protein